MALKGKKAIVTGSSGALGSVVAQRFLAEGMMVAGTYRNSKENETISGPFGALFFPVQADVTDEPQVHHLFESAMARMGGIDILVNTVGGYLPRTSIVDLSVADWHKMMDLNLNSTFLCTREALRFMKKGTYGRIVNISAMGGLRPTPGRAAYAISKSAVSLLTDLAGQETKGTGITVNAIAPDIIDTEANRESMPDGNFAQWVKPEHIADTICYLCSDSAAEITGTTIQALGGS